MQVRVIDDTGVVWDAASRAFREEFYLTRTEGDMSPHFVDAMGFIRMLFPRGATPIVCFNPGRVTKPALAGLNYWLEKHPCDRLSLAHGPPGAVLGHQIFGSTLAALHQVDALIEQARGPELPFASLPELLDHVHRVTAFGALFEHWCASGGIFTDADYRPLLNRFASDRFVIFAPRPSDGALKIVHAGSGLRIPDKRSHASLTGSQLEDVADHAFGRWTSGIYRGVLLRQQPRCDRIYAMIHWPSVGRVERKYSRLILPCRTKDGQHLLLGVSGDLGAPDLELEAA